MLSSQSASSVKKNTSSSKYQPITYSNEELTEKLAHLSAIVEHSEDSIISKDLEGIVTSWNPASERLYGFTKEEMIGSSILKIYPPELHDEFEIIMDLLRKGESIEHYDTVRVRKDGKRLSVSVSISPIKDPNGKTIGVSHIGRDISDRIELEHRKDDFISIASHEFKTPLTTLKGFIQILSQDSGNLTSSQCLYLEKMNNQIDKLTLLVNDLLDVSRIRQGKVGLKREPFDLDQLVTEVADDFRQTNHHRILIKAKSGVKIKADKERINQVLVNLISNAIKYSPQADEVIISSQKKAQEVIVSVQDFGIGIFKTDQEKIFQRFYQARNKIRASFAGLGLGLFICAEIIKQHQGQIWVESVKGEGSTFFFSLPLS